MLPPFYPKEILGGFAMNLTGYPLSLNGETFNGFKTDFDQVLRQLLTEMEKQESEEAVITVKMTVQLKPDQARDFLANGHDAMRDITKPTFKHDISSVLQVKQKKSGSLGGDMELVWDRELHQYSLRPIDNGQTSIFNTQQAEVQNPSQNDTPQDYRYEDPDEEAGGE